MDRAVAPPALASRRGIRRRWWLRLAGAILLALILWLAITAPLSKSLEPPVPVAITLLSVEGRPIARQGARFEAPVTRDDLPARVWMPVLAIEDRRFFQHVGIDSIGLARAAWRNLLSGGVREGGSTITQQLAKQNFLTADRTIARKIREVLIAFWLELWLSKEEILTRYLSTAYYGNNLYGLRAASRYYFRREPAELSQEQAAMLAGLVRAPSRLNPRADLAAARARTREVLGAMVDAGLLGEDEARALPPVRPASPPRSDVPTGTYFADWILAEAREEAVREGSRTVRTTLEYGLQRAAIAAVGRGRLGGAQVALVAMRPDGRVVAMLGGRSYRQSAFNRATQARRQPGSTFKLAVYLAAFRDGLTPDSMVDDAPVTIGDWSPANADGRYRGPVSLREAFALSSNVAAARLADRVGIAAVADAARDLGITSRLEQTPSLALGTSGLSLLELTSAYASAASGRYPTRPVGLLSAMPSAPDRERDQEQFDAETHWPMLLDILWFSTNVGTGHAAALDFPTFGKTGTSQDNRDAVFVGFAGDLIAAVWVGYDDNRPLGDVHGGDVPALIWRDFMQRADRAGAIDRAFARPFTARFVPEPEEPPSKPDDDGFVTVERRFDPEPFADSEFEPADRFRERPRDRKRKPGRGHGRQR